MLLMIGEQGETNSATGNKLCVLLWWFDCRSRSKRPMVPHRCSDRLRADDFGNFLRVHHGTCIPDREILLRAAQRSCCSRSKSLAGLSPDSVTHGKTQKRGAGQRQGEEKESHLR